MLICAYALTGRPIEPLVKVLYPEHSEADIEEIKKLLHETKFAGRSQNGLLQTAQQFAAAVYGRKVGRGAHPEQSAGEHLLACHITERREAGLTDEEIRQEILDSGRELSNEDFPCRGGRTVMVSRTHGEGQHSPTPIGPGPPARKQEERAAR
jgi:hypothetical protein